MLEPRSLFRFAALAASAILITTCAANPGATSPSPGSGSLRSGPCASGAPPSADMNAPIVCVDDSGSALTVDPDPVRVHDVVAPGKAPVVLQWFTRSGGNNLHIDIENGCTEKVTCNRGHCTTKTLPSNGTEKRCKYSVWTDNHPKLDPDIIITPCC